MRNGTAVTVLVEARELMWVKNNVEVIVHCTAQPSSSSSSRTTWSSSPAATYPKPPRQIIAMFTNQYQLVSSAARSTCCGMEV